MAEEVREIVEVLHLIGAFSARLSNASIRGLSFVARLWYSNHWDQRGKQDFEYVLKACEKRGCGLEFMDVATEDPETIRRIESKAAELNVQYALLPDLCQGDGYTQFAMPSDHMSLFSKVLESEIDIECRQLNYEDYEKTADEEARKAIREEAERNIRREDIDPVRVKGAEKEYEDANFKTVSLNKKSLLAKQTDNEMIFYIPGTNRSRLLPVSPKDIVSEDAKTVWVKIDKNHDYTIGDLNSDNPPKIRGKELLERFSDPFRVVSGERPERSAAKDLNLKKEEDKSRGRSSREEKRR